MRLQSPRYFQSVVEWTYPKAHRYWDDCGKLIARVEGAFPGLNCQGLEANGFNFAGLSKGVTQAMFYWNRANISQRDQSNVGLASAAETFWPLVADGLGVADPTRIGHRTWFVFETPSVKDAIRHLDALSLWAFDGAADIGQPSATGCVLRTTLGAGRRLRMEINAGTVELVPRKIQGVVVDVDVICEQEVATISPAEFLQQNFELIRTRVEPLFRRKGSK